METITNYVMEIIGKGKSQLD